jgi:periplasmic protein TonB
MDMTKLYRAALPLMTMLVAPMATLEARQTAPEITVTAPAAGEIQAWSARVGSAIDREMRYPRLLGLSNSDEGTVDVTFRCSEDGTPTEVALARTSGSRLLDRAGVKAVQRVGSLHPLPNGVSHAQVYRARMLFAIENGMGRAERKAEALRGTADAANERLARNRQVAAGTVVTLMPAGAP